MFVKVVKCPLMKCKRVVRFDLYFLKFFFFEKSVNGCVRAKRIVGAREWWWRLSVAEPPPPLTATAHRPTRWLV